MQIATSAAAAALLACAPGCQGRAEPAQTPGPELRAAQPAQSAQPPTSSQAAVVAQPSAAGEARVPPASAGTRALPPSVPAVAGMRAPVRDPVDADAGAEPGCAGPGVLLCDDFESGSAVGVPPPAPRWQLALNGMGKVAVDGVTPAHSGTRSVHVSSAGGYQTFFALSGAPVFPAAGPLYLRLYIRLGAPMPMGHNTYYKAGAAGPSSDHETRVGVMNGMLMINQPAGDRGFLSNERYYQDGNKPGVVFPPNTWTCVEALFDPARSTIQLWVNDKDVPDLHRTDWQQDPLASFHFGYEKYAGPDADIWYDDIAVSKQRIGCQP